MDNLDIAFDQYEEMRITGDPGLDCDYDDCDEDVFDKECKHCGEKNLKWREVDNI